MIPILIAILFVLVLVLKYKGGKEEFRPYIVNSGYGFAYPGGFGQWPYRPSLFNWQGHIAYPSYINNYYTEDEPVCWKQLNAIDLFKKPFPTKREWFLKLRKMGINRYLQPKSTTSYVMVATFGYCGTGRLGLGDSYKYYDVRM